MFKKQLMNLIAVAAASGLGVSTIQAAGNNCMTVGGLGMGNFLPQGDGTSNIVAPLTGSFAAASGRIIAQREIPSGFEMDLEHHFVAADGGYMHTIDRGFLSKVAGKEHRFLIEITYDVQEASTYGSFNGYKGSFKSFGAVDMEANKGLVRYSGQICL